MSYLTSLEKRASFPLRPAEQEEEEVKVADITAPTTPITTSVTKGSVIQPSVDLLPMEGKQAEYSFKIDDSPKESPFDIAFGSPESLASLYAEVVDTTGKARYAAGQLAEQYNFDDQEEPGVLEGLAREIAGTSPITGVLSKAPFFSRDPSDEKDVLKRADVDSYMLESAEGTSEKPSPVTGLSQVVLGASAIDPKSPSAQALKKQGRSVKKIRTAEDILVDVVNERLRTAFISQADNKAAGTKAYNDYVQNIVDRSTEEGIDLSFGDARRALATEVVNRLPKAPGQGDPGIVVAQRDAVNLVSGITDKSFGRELAQTGLFAPVRVAVTDAEELGDPIDPNRTFDPYVEEDAEMKLSDPLGARARGPVAGGEAERAQFLEQRLFFPVDFQYDKEKSLKTSTTAAQTMNDLIADGSLILAAATGNFDDLYQVQKTVVESFGSKAVESEDEQNRIIALSAKAGIPVDKTYAVSKAESTGDPASFAFNLHLGQYNPEDPDNPRNRTAEQEQQLRQAMISEGLDVNVESLAAQNYYGEKAKKAFELAAAVNPVAAVQGGAFGEYQVTGKYGDALGYVKETFPEVETDERAAAVFIGMFKQNPGVVGDDMFARWFQQNPKAQKAANDGDIVALAEEYYGSLLDPEEDGITDSEKKRREKQVMTRNGWVDRATKASETYLTGMFTSSEKTIRPEKQSAVMPTDDPPTLLSQRGASEEDDLFTSEEYTRDRTDVEEALQLNAIEVDTGLSTVMTMFSDLREAPTPGSPAFIAAVSPIRDTKENDAQLYTVIEDNKDAPMGTGFRKVSNFLFERKVSQSLGERPLSDLSAEEAKKLKADARQEAFILVTSAQTDNMWLTPFYTSFDYLLGEGEDDVFDAMAPRIEVMGRTKDGFVFRQEGNVLAAAAALDAPAVLGQSFTIGVLGSYVFPAIEEAYTEYVQGQRSAASLAFAVTGATSSAVAGSFAAYIPFSNELGVEFFNEVHRAGVQGVAERQNFVEVGLSAGANVFAATAETLLETELGREALDVLIDSGSLPMPYELTAPARRYLSVVDMARATGTAVGMLAGLAAAVNVPDATDFLVVPKALATGRRAYRLIKDLDLTAEGRDALTKTNTFSRAVGLRPQMFLHGEARRTTLAQLAVTLEKTSAKDLEGASNEDIASLLQLVDDVLETSRKQDEADGLFRNDLTASIKVEVDLEAENTLAFRAQTQTPAGEAARSAVDETLSKNVHATIKDLIEDGKASKDPRRVGLATALEDRLTASQLREAVTLSPGQTDAFLKAAEQAVGPESVFGFTQRIEILRDALLLIDPASDGMEIRRRVFERRLTSARLDRVGNTPTADLPGFVDPTLSKGLDYYGPVDASDLDKSLDGSRLPDAQKTEVRQTRDALEDWHKRFKAAVEDKSILDPQVRDAFRAEFESNQFAEKSYRIFRNSDTSRKGNYYRDIVRGIEGIAGDATNAAFGQNIIARGLQAVVAAADARGAAYKRFAVALVDKNKLEALDSSLEVEKFLAGGETALRMRRFRYALQSGTKEGVLQLVLANPVLSRLVPKELRAQYAVSAAARMAKRQEMILQQKSPLDMANLFQKEVLTKLSQRLAAATARGDEPAVAKLTADIEEVNSPEFFRKMSLWLDDSMAELKNAAADGRAANLPVIDLPVGIDPSIVKRMDIKAEPLSATRKFFRERYSPAFSFGATKEADTRSLVGETEDLLTRLNAVEKRANEIVLDQLLRYMAKVDPTDSRVIAERKVQDFINKRLTVRSIGAYDFESRRVELGAQLDDLSEQIAQSRFGQSVNDLGTRARVQVRSDAFSALIPLMSPYEATLIFTRSMDELKEILADARLIGPRLPGDEADDVILSTLFQTDEAEAATPRAVPIRPDDPRFEKGVVPTKGELSELGRKYVQKNIQDIEASPDFVGKTALLVQLRKSEEQGLIDPIANLLVQIAKTLRGDVSEGRRALAQRSLETIAKVEPRFLDENAATEAAMPVAGRDLPSAEKTLEAIDDEDLAQLAREADDRTPVFASITAKATEVVEEAAPAVRAAEKPPKNEGLVTIENRLLEMDADRRATEAARDNAFDEYDALIAAGVPASDIRVVRANMDAFNRRYRLDELRGQREKVQEIFDRTKKIVDQGYASSSFESDPRIVRITDEILRLKEARQKMFDRSSEASRAQQALLAEDGVTERSRKYRKAKKEAESLQDKLRIIQSKLIDAESDRERGLKALQKEAETGAEGAKESLDFPAYGINFHRSARAELSSDIGRTESTFEARYFDDGMYRTVTFVLDGDSKRVKSGREKFGLRVYLGRSDDYRFDSKYDLDKLEARSLVIPGMPENIVNRAKTPSEAGNLVREFLRVKAVEGITRADAERAARMGRPDPATIRGDTAFVAKTERVDSEIANLESEVRAQKITEENLSQDLKSAEDALSTAKADPSANRLRVYRLTEKAEELRKSAESARRARSLAEKNLADAKETQATAETTSALAVKATEEIVKEAVPTARVTAEALDATDPAALKATPPSAAAARLAAVSDITKDEQKTVNAVDDLVDSLAPESAKKIEQRATRLNKLIEKTDEIEEMSRQQVVDYVFDDLDAGAREALVNSGAIDDMVNDLVRIFDRNLKDVQYESRRLRRTAVSLRKLSEKLEGKEQRRALQAADRAEQRASAMDDALREVMESDRLKDFADLLESERVSGVERRKAAKKAAEAVKKTKETRSQGTSKIPQDIKGMVYFTEDSQAIVLAFKSADAETGLHEMAHVLRRNLRESDLQVSLDWVNSQLKNAGLTPVRLAYGVDSQVGNFIGRADSVHFAEEAFADSFVQYMREGVAPTNLLSSVFKVMKDLLHNIFIAAKQQPAKMEISPEMYAVFDRVFGAKQSFTLDDIPAVSMFLNVQDDLGRSAVGLGGRLETDLVVEDTITDRFRQIEMSFDDYRRRMFKSGETGIVGTMVGGLSKTFLLKTPDTAVGGLGLGSRTTQYLDPISSRVLSIEDRVLLNRFRRGEIGRDELPNQLLPEAEKILRVLGETVVLGGSMALKAARLMYGDDASRAVRAMKPAQRVHTMGGAREGEEFSNGLSVLANDITRRMGASANRAVNDLISYLSGRSAQLLTGSERGKRLSATNVDTFEHMARMIHDMLWRMDPEARIALTQAAEKRLSNPLRASTQDDILPLAGMWRGYKVRSQKNASAPASDFAGKGILLGNDYLDVLPPKYSRGDGIEIDSHLQDSLGDIFVAATGQTVIESGAISGDALDLAALLVVHSGGSMLKASDGSAVHIDAVLHAAGVTRGEALIKGVSAEVNGVSVKIPGLLDTSVSSDRRTPVLIALGNAGFSAGMLDDAAQWGFGINGREYRAFLRYVTGQQGSMSVDEIDVAKNVIDRFGVSAEFVMNERRMGQYYLPKQARDALKNQMAQAARQFDYSANGRDGNAAQTIFGLYNSLLYSAMVFGAVVVKPVYRLASLLDIGNGAAASANIRAGAAAMARAGVGSLLAFAYEGLPLLSLERAAEGAGLVGDLAKSGAARARGVDPSVVTVTDLKQRLRDKAAESGDALGRMISQASASAKYRAEVRPIMEAREDMIFVINGRPYRASDLRRVFVRSGLYNNMFKSIKATYMAEGGSLSELMDRAKRAVGIDSPNSKMLNSFIDETTNPEGPVNLMGGIRGAGDMALRHGLESADAWADLERTGLAVTFMELGYSPQTAARMVVESVYDYRGSMTAGDRSLLNRAVRPFFAFTKNAIHHLTNLMSSPLGRFYARSMAKLPFLSADAVTTVFYEFLVGPYGINTSAMNSSELNAYYDMRIFLEYGLGDQVDRKTLQRYREILPEDQADISDEELMDYSFGGWSIRNGHNGYDNVPDDARVAVRALIASRSKLYSKGRYLYVAKVLEDEELRREFVQLGGSMVVRDEPNRRGQAAYMFNRYPTVQVPFPVLNASAQEAMRLGLNDSIFWMLPDNFVHSGIDEASSMMATLFVLGDEAYSVVSDERRFVPDVALERLIRAGAPLVDVRGYGSPIAEELIKGSLTLAGEDTPMFVEVDPFIARVLQGSMIPVANADDIDEDDLSILSQLAQSDPDFYNQAIKFFGQLSGVGLSREIEFPAFAEETRAARIVVKDGKREVVFADQGSDADREFIDERRESVRKKPFLVGKSALFFKVTPLGLLNQAFLQYRKTAQEDQLAAQEELRSQIIRFLTAQGRQVGMRTAASDEERTTKSIERAASKVFDEYK